LWRKGKKICGGDRLSQTVGLDSRQLIDIDGRGQWNVGKTALAFKVNLHPDLRAYGHISPSLWFGLTEIRKINTRVFEGNWRPHRGCSSGGSPRVELDDPLCASSAANGLRRATGNSPSSCQDASLCSGYLGRVCELCGGPEVLQGCVPDLGGFIHAKIGRHQVKPAVDNPGVDVWVATGYIARHSLRLGIGSQDWVVVGSTGVRHGANCLAIQLRGHDSLPDQPVE